MAIRGFFHTVTPMTTYLPPLSISTVGDRAARERVAHPARWRSRSSDRKVTLLAQIDAFSSLRKADLIALGAAADVIATPAGEVLAQDRDLSRHWWMPLDGWLLLSGQGKQAITVPAGWSFTADRNGPLTGRLSALREGRILTAPIQSLLGALDAHPHLAEAVRSTMVSIDV